MTTCPSRARPIQIPTTFRPQEMILMTTSLRRAPAPTLTAALTLALTLTGCGGTPPDAPTPPPDAGPAAPQAQPLIPFQTPTVTGIGTYDRGTYTKAPTPESCASPQGAESCVSWTAPLPAPPPGYRVQVSPVVPLLTVAGGQAVVGDPPCTEPLTVLSYYGTDLDAVRRRFEGSGAPLPVAPGAARITVGLCFWGEVRARMAPLTGSITFVPAP